LEKKGRKLDRRETSVIIHLEVCLWKKKITEEKSWELIQGRWGRPWVLSQESAIFEKKAEVWGGLLAITVKDQFNTLQKA